jgi:serine/threonine protein kinase
MDRQRSQPGIQVGSTLGRYEILGLIGAGGMGQVYRARDGSLGREVAIKVLPAEVASDPARLSRFRREARILAALSHPNIGAIFGLEEEGGKPFLALELVPGQTLAERLERGPMAVGEAVDVARQVAAALEAAHDRGIVHRDLKPANVKWDAKGRVRVLDFGLAATRERLDTSTSGELSQSPTVTAALTVEGSVMGTARYMSPEQARGEDVGPRTDVWALGCLLFELLTGRAPFARSSLGETLAAVLGEEPDFTALPGSASSLRWVLRRCLEKDPDERWHHAADVRIALTEVDAGGPPADEGASDRSSSRYGPRALVLSALGALALAGIALWPLWPRPRVDETSPSVSFSFRLPRGYGLEPAPPWAPYEIAPDGSFLVFSARPPDEEPRVFRRSLDSVEIAPVAGTEGGREPFVSPDGRWIGYFTREGGLAKVPVEGGVPQRIFDAERLLPAGASWDSRDRIYFPRGLTGGIGGISASGRDYERLTRPDSAAGEIGHWNPQPLVGRRKLLFGAVTAAGWKSQILDLVTGERRTLEASGLSPRYVDTGHLVWLEGDELVAAPFDVEAERLGERIAMLSGVTSFDVSRGGTLAYTAGPAGRSDGIASRWSAADGGPTPLPGSARGGQLRLSPDGRRLAFWADRDLWIVELDRGVISRFTTGGFVNNFPVWSADGERLLFNSIREIHGLYVRSTDGIGETRLVLARESETVLLPASWSPDGRSVAVTELRPDGGADVAVVDVASGERESVVSTAALEHSPAFSPDGRWLAYVSDESGRDEVYVRPYPEAGRRVTISTAGGTEPRWTVGGRSLLFRRGAAIYEIETGLGRDEEGELQPGRLQQRAELPSFLDSIVPFGPTWDVAPNGDLVYLRASEPTEPIEIFVVLGWARELPPLPRGMQ